MAGTLLRKRQVYERLKSKLWTDRSSFDGRWMDVADYLKPTRLRMNTTERNRGDRRNQNIYDETGVFAADTLASGLHAGMSSPARPWFTLSVPDPTLAQSDNVKGYLHDAEERMNAVFALSNLYNCLPEVYGDVSSFGTAAVAEFRDSEDLVRFYTYPLGSYAIGLNNRREVCTFVMEEQFTVRQVIQEFGIRDSQGALTNRENFSQHVLNHWDEERFEEVVEVCWVVMPNEYQNPEKLDAKYLPFTSCWFEQATAKNSLTTHDQVLRESGFRTFPVMAPRWAVTGNDSYGTNCPGFTALPAVKQLQTMERKGQQLLAKVIDPPLRGSTNLKNQPTSLVAGHITFDNPRDQASALQPIHEVRLEGYQHFEQKAEQVRARVRSAFHTDMFLMFQSQPYGTPMTATEVQERHQEKLLILGPALERMNEELLEKIVDRTWDVMEAAGLLPEAPEELQGVTIKVEFVSVLAEAQKMTRVLGLDALVNRILPMAEAIPAVLDKFDAFAFVDELQSAIGGNPKIIRSNEAAMAIAADRAKQAQAAQAAEAAASMAGAAKDLGTTPMTGDTALTGLMQAAGAA